MKKKFRENITHKISETNFNLQLKWRTTRKISVFQELSSSINKLSFWQKGWALGYHSIRFRQFPDIS